MLKSFSTEYLKYLFQNVEVLFSSINFENSYLNNHSTFIFVYETSSTWFEPVIPIFSIHKSGPL